MFPYVKSSNFEVAKKKYIERETSSVLLINVLNGALVTLKICQTPPFVNSRVYEK